MKKRIFGSIFLITLVISNPVVNNDEVTVQVEVDGVTIKNYLQGMFTKSTTTPSYFGFTQNNFEDWYKYVGSPEKSEIQSTFFSFTPKESTWSGQLKIKNDPADPDYIGPGDYTLRVRRYTGNSTSPAGDPSNDLIIQLAYIIPVPTSTPTPSASATNTPIPTPTKTPTPSPTKTPTPKPTSTPIETLETPETLVLGIENKSDEKEASESQEGKKGFSLLPLLFVAAGLTCIGTAFFLVFRKSKAYNKKSEENS